MTDETYAITRMFGAADKAENVMIRGISYLINKAVTEAGKESLEKIRPLLDLQDALKVDIERLIYMKKTTTDCLRVI